MENKLVLGYWPIRGIAQPIRFFLEYLEIPYEEKRYTDHEEWFNKDYATFGHPFTNLPYLKDGTNVVFESDALYYYIATKANRLDLVGKDGLHQTQVAMIRGVINDLKASFLGWSYGSKETAEADKPEMLATCGEFFAGFNQLLQKTTWTTGETITYVDFLLWEYIDEFLVFSPEVITSKPKLVEFHTRISQIPQIQKYLENPNYIKRPFNSPAHAIFH